MKYSGIICLLLLSYSCSDFLEEESKNIDQEHYTTEEGLRDGIFSVYANFRNIYSTAMFRIHTYSDIWDVGASRSDSEEISESIDNGDVADLWEFVNSGIMRSNRMLTYVSSGHPDLDEASALEYQAELRTLRAFLTWINAEFWGAHAHFQDQVFNEFDPAMQEINQVPVEVLYKQILEDIDFGIANLPASFSEFGRVNKGVAEAMKARFLMSLAGYSHPDYTGTPEHNVFTKLGFGSAAEVYAGARTLARNVIDNYGYQLEEDFSAIFSDENQTGAEVIWSVQWTKDMIYNSDDYPNYFHRYATGRTCQTIVQAMEGGGTITYTGIAADRTGAAGKTDYSMPCHSRWYGREYRHMIPTYNWIMAYAPEDRRRGATFETLYYRLKSDVGEPDYTDTIVYMPFREVPYEEDQAWRRRGVFLDGLNEVYDLDDPGSEYYGGPRTIGRSKSYSLLKFYDRSRTNQPKQDQGHENGIVMRLAEMYLIAAECAWKLGEGEQEVYAILEQSLWQRAFEDPAAAEVYKTGLDQDFFLDEYAREMGGEFMRWFILKRSRSLVRRINEWVPKSREEAENGTKRSRDFIAEHHYLKPVPSSDLIRFSNWKPEMQVPGY